MPVPQTWHEADFSLYYSIYSILSMGIMDTLFNWPTSDPERALTFLLKCLKKPSESCKYQIL